MMDFFLGRGNFQNGLSDYLDTFKYGNTESKDLWNKLSKAVKGTPHHVDVANVMDTWTLQMGYPVITVNKNGASATVNQERFLLDGESNDSEGKFGYKWEVPFTYATQAKPQWNSSLSEIHWMHKDGTDLTLSGLDADSWIIGNVEQMGFYRVNYDADNWNKIIKQLTDNHMEIDVKNRAQILGDVFNLARANELSYANAFRTTKYLKTEADYIPWAAATSAMGFVGQILSTTATYGKYGKYMIALGKDRYNALGFEEGASDSPLTIYLRAKIVSLMCSSGYQPCLDAAVKSLKQWKKTEAASPGAKNPVNLNLRSQIYCYGIQNGDSEMWDFMFEMYKKEDVAAEKKRLMGSLACSKEPLILSRLLEMAVSDQPNNPIRRQDTTSVIQHVAGNDVGKYLAWDFIRENWDMLRSQFGGGSFSFSRLILAVTSTFATDYKLKQLEAFMKAKPDLGSAARAFDQAIEKTKANIKWIDANLKEVNKWLEDNI
jgi:aminopeptidase N